MIMESESERKTRTTTTTTTTARRTTKPTSGNAVQKTRISIGGAKGSYGTRTNVINEPEMSSKKYVQVLELAKQPEVAIKGKKVPSSRSCNSEKTTKNDGQLQALEQQLEGSCNSDSSNSKTLKSSTYSPPIQLLKKSRSQPLEAGSSTESCLRKVKSDNAAAAAAMAYQPPNLEASLTLCDSVQDVQQRFIDKDLDSEEFQDQVIDHSSSKMALEEEEDGIEVVKKKEEVQEPSSSAFDEVNVCETEERVQASPKEQNVINKISDPMDDGIGVKNENGNESEQNKIIGKPDDNSGGDQLHEVNVSLKVSQIKSKRMPSSSVPEINPASATSPCPSTSRAGSCKLVPFGSRSVPRPSSSPLSPQSTARKASFEYSNSSKHHPEPHGKLQFLVDLVMWRDVSRSAFIFGAGTFIILSSSYAEDINFSLISVVSYLTLAYLAIVFFCKSIVNRGAMDDGEVVPENYIWGEDEAIWFAKIILPYLNESFLKLRVLFSGDPAMTMKVSTLLFILARCGNSITVWKMAKLGFFGVFIIPKFCSSYSTQIMAYGKFWIWRFQDAWKSCLHKKVVAFVVFTMVWNFSSVVARAWAAFMLFVAFRYYHHQYITSQDNISEEKVKFHDVQILGSARHRRNASTPSMTSLNQNKEKKSF